MYRYELSDVHWAQMASFFPDCYHSGRAGHPWKAHRPLVNGILWRLPTGAPWADVPERSGPWKTGYNRFIAIFKCLRPDTHNAETTPGGRVE
jgi:transposase